MKVYVSVKQAGKRKDYITKKKVVLEAVPSCLRELIAGIVQISVHEYNTKAVEPAILHYLSAEKIESQAQTGKVGFGDRKNAREANVKEAIDLALLAFRDGIFRVFLGDTELSALDEPIAINDGDVLTFIRFTMLAGRMW